MYLPPRSRDPHAGPAELELELERELPSGSDLNWGASS